jgi:methyl-accepting chemotaxis protein
MERVTEKLSNISDQTQELRSNSKHIVEAMYTIDSITETLLADAMNIASTTANNLVQQADVLQRIINTFKVS